MSEHAGKSKGRRVGLDGDRIVDTATEAFLTADKMATLKGTRQRDPEMP